MRVKILTEVLRSADGYKCVVSHSEENLLPEQIFHIRNKCLYLRHYAMDEAVEPFKLLPHPCHTYEVFVGIWMHIHSVTTTDVSPD